MPLRALLLQMDSARLATLSPPTEARAAHARMAEFHDGGSAKQQTGFGRRDHAS